jgi:hypothetical protein
LYALSVKSELRKYPYASSVTARTADAVCSSKIRGMSKRRPIVLVAVLTLSATSLIAATTRAHGSVAVARPSPSTLTAVRDRVEMWLDANGFDHFQVDEVMAFTTNDYAAVSDRAGKPAFELLVAPDRSWLMEEPASMMWNTKYGCSRTRAAPSNRSPASGWCGA